MAAIWPPVAGMPRAKVTSARAGEAARSAAAQADSISFVIAFMVFLP
jgi:hypothetical protein